MAISITVNCQVTVSFNSFDVGEYLAVKSSYSILRNSPDTNAIILDTIFDNYHGLTFEVLKENSTNNFVKVKVLSGKWANGMPDPETGIYSLPSSIDNGYEGWVLKKELMKHPVPDGFLMPVYENNEKFLLAIIDNADWHYFNNKKDYKMYKSEHASAYLSLGKNYYESDSSKLAIYYLTKSIGVLPKSRAYMIRALAKMNLQDFQGAINDCNQSLSLKKNPIKPSVYEVSYLSSMDLRYDLMNFNSVRGFCYLEMKKYTLAVEDFNEAIKSDDSNGQNYYYRGISKYFLGQKTSGCSDLSKAGELGFEQAYDIIKSNCN
jgi:tetratricopeptide (TPR) repeat protein